MNDSNLPTSIRGLLSKHFCIYQLILFVEEFKKEVAMSRKGPQSNQRQNKVPLLDASQLRMDYFHCKKTCDLVEMLMGVKLHCLCQNALVSHKHCARRLSVVAVAVYYGNKRKVDFPR